MGRAFTVITSIAEQTKEQTHQQIKRVTIPLPAKGKKSVDAKKESIMGRSQITLPSSLCYAMQLGGSIIYPSGSRYVYARIRDSNIKEEE